MSGTVPGSSGTVITVSTDHSSAPLMQAVSNAISLAETSGSFSVTAAPTTGTVPTPPAASNNELVLTGSSPGAVSVPAGYDWIVNTASAPTTGDSSTTISAGVASSGLYVFGGSGNLDFIGGAGGSTIIGGSGNATVTGGTGALVFGAGQGTASVAGGSGGTTLFGAANSNITYTGSVGAALYAAQSGNETISASGSSTNNLFFAGTDPAGHNLIEGGSGSDTFTAGAGSDTFSGGGGGDVFFFNAGQTAGAVDLIIDFQPNYTVNLTGYGTGAAAKALSNAVTANGNTTITLSDHTAITFVGMSANQLTGHINSA
jgi:Ca2+-binding RTX toxin-like protein